jgi:hypothetical protein
LDGTLVPGRVVLSAFNDGAHMVKPEAGAAEATLAPDE